MMRCANTSCGVKGKGHFCQECGSKMVEDCSLDTVVICNGKLDDGSPCHAELVPSKKFCKNCGKKVDPNLFLSTKLTCSKCQTVLEPGSIFCSECGHKQQKPSDVQDQTQVVSSETMPVKEPVVGQGDTHLNLPKKHIASHVTDNPQQQELLKQTHSEHELDVATNTAVGECQTIIDLTDDLNESKIHTDSDVEIIQVEEFCIDLNNESSTSKRYEGIEPGGKRDDAEMGENQNLSLDAKSADKSESSDMPQSTIVSTPGNLNVVTTRSTSPTDEKLTEQLAGVHIENKLPPGNLKIVDESQKPDVQEKEGESIDVEYDSDDSKSSVDILSNDGGYKRSRRQRKNDRKRKQFDEVVDLTGDDEDVPALVSPSSKDNKSLDTHVETIRGNKELDDEQSDNETVNDDEHVAKVKPSRLMSKEEKAEKSLLDRNKNTSTATDTEDNSRHLDDNLTNSASLATQSGQPTTPTARVFGAGKSIGVTQDEGHFQVSSPFGQSLFTIEKPVDSDDAASRTNPTQTQWLNKNRKIAERTTSVPVQETAGGSNSVNANDLKNERLKNANKKDGIDVDTVATGMETRSKMKAKLVNKNEQPGQAKSKQQDQARAQSKPGENKATAAEKKFNERCIAVEFHVLTSEEFKFDPTTHNCIVVIGEKEMGGWHRKDRIMKSKRHISGHVYEMVHEEFIPTRLIAGGLSIPYKYMIHKKDKPDKENWDHYVKNYKYGLGVDRDLTVYLKLKDLDGRWQQWDCFMECKPKGLTAKVVDYFTSRSNLKDHAEKAVDIFCPDFFQYYKSTMPLEEITLQVKMLFECMRKIYMVDGHCWSDNKEFTKAFGEMVLSAAFQKSNVEELTSSENIEQSEKANITALTVLYVTMLLENGVSDLKQIRTLAKALKLRSDTEKQECHAVQNALKAFPGKRQQLLDALLSFVKHIVSTTKDPCWLTVMPWIHFLNNECQPYDKPVFDVKHDHHRPVWWGVDTIEKELSFFKGKSSKWSIPVEEMIKHIQPLFQLDYLLPRTFMAAVDLQDLKVVIETRTIPIEVCLAHLTYRLKTILPMSYYDYGSHSHRISATMSTEEKIVYECVDAVVKQLQETFFSEDINHIQWNMAYVIASNMLSRGIDNKRVETACLCAQVFIHCTAMYDRVLTEQNKTQETKYSADHLDVLRASAAQTVRFLELYRNWEFQMSDILLNWNRVFSPVVLQSEPVRNIWNKILADALKQNVERKVCSTSRQMQQYIELYCKRVDEFNPAMQECMSQAAFLAIEKGFTVDYGHFLPYENERYGKLLSHLFSTEWKKHVKKTDANADVSMFLHALRWPPFSQFMKIYYQDQKKINMLTEECVEYLVQAVSVIENRVQALLKGEITIGDLKSVIEKAEKFAELAELIQSEMHYTSSVVLKAVNLREKELEEFQKQSKQMATLASLCTQLANVDRKCIDETLKKQEKIEQHMVKEFCVPVDVKQVENVADYIPKPCAFKVTAPVLQMAPELHKCCESSTFMKIWNNLCQEVYGQCRTLEEVVVQVWIPVKKMWDKWATKIRIGTIKFKDFEQILGKIYRESFDQMHIEMVSMNVPEKVIKTRIEQLKQYRQLERCVKGAKTILKFSKQFKLTGDFEQIRVIASHGETDLEMKSFDSTVMKACELLKDLTPPKAKCLQMFVSCEGLVQWLKESMKGSGLKELKVFVDLAFMSAGDEPINVARVQCLHTAVTGYAPLIFDLEEKCGYKELLQLCSIVWKELEANPELPEKLRDTSRQIQWLKDVKKAHGSVEVTSLMQAEAINSTGIFTIGKNAWKKDTKNQSPDGSLQMVADIVQLTVPEKEGKIQLRNYSFSQLQDLQSRLMLVAGKAEKGTDSVDRFTMIFDSVTRLSNVYLKLCSSGCVLFKDFTARFLCDPNRPACIFLNFGQGDDSSQIKGRKSLEEDLKEMIPEIAKFLETCLEEWLHHIKEKRKSYLHLNYFTVDQLVILQRELVKVGTEEEPTHLIYPLLSAVKENCHPGDLVKAMENAKAEIENEFEMETVLNDSGVSEIPANSTLDEKRHNFIKELVEAGYEEALAVRALEFVDPEDVTQGIVWCMDHEDSAMSDDTSLEPTPQETARGEKLTQGPAFPGWSQSTTDIQTLIATNISGLKKQNDVGSKPLLEQLSMLWGIFLKSISSNIRDYLSLEHLGLILKYLAQTNHKEICRTLPPGFKEGQPNLVICPSADVLMTTLSIYRMNKDQPLPESDEVLMCTPSTSTDEVDIFWRRAIFDSGKKIHCLVNADMLDYDISEAAERCLEHYLQDVHYKDLKFRLLVICGSDNEYRSGIVSSLDKFKRQPLPINMLHLRDYILNKLTVQQQTVSKIKPAASVDRERSSVRVIKSWRAGVGKTLFKKRREEELCRLHPGAQKSETVSIPLQEKSIDLHYVIARLLEHTIYPNESAARIFHIDISHEVQDGVDYLLFNLLVLGCLVDKTGFVWRKSPTDIYLIETMPLMMQAANRRAGDLQYVHPMLGILPDLTCRSPQESLDIYQGHRPHDFKEHHDQLFDDKQFRSPVFQRTFQYLHRLDQGRQLEDVSPHNAEGTPQACLQTLLKHCGLKDPSWSELHHFVWFLNTQLVDFEQNSFVSMAAAEDLPGFTKFVLRFLITMSRDFSTRSLDISEESPGLRAEHRQATAREEDIDMEHQEGDAELRAYQMRRTWESSPHPYLFFNSDRFTFTFLGFFIDRASGNLIDSQTRTILERGIMAQNLYDSLVRNHAPMQENFDALPRDQKITKLCNVMGIEFPHDPDDTYELTTDNVKKIMAIYMRFRCDIPVIVMGETGCGKTRLVKFMCGLQVPPGVEMTNMILMKVHGGTTSRDIERKVREAEAVARENRENYGQHVYTVLFFDEANTTECIGLIKEIMCDRSMEGKKLQLCENLKMVAACNPYRKHSEQLIRKLEQAGLGYHVDADDTTDRLGRVPMRRLVYRVQPLPQSLLPLVWDFGQLNTQVEDLYIRQMVRRYIREDKLPDIPNLKETVSAILTASQEYMRIQKDECSFVSLRDVDRVLTVMSWFYQQSQNGRTLFKLMDKKLNTDGEIYETSDDEEENVAEEEGEDILTDVQARGYHVDDITRSLILALGVCYHACLRTRPQYRAHVARYFSAPCQLTGGPDQIGREIECCQEVFLDHVHLEKNIARNMALKENVFMMVVCIELRVPLFLVGKPGSSKSLAKTIVSDAMQGNASREDLFKELKQAQMVSFQCSPLSTPDGIVGTFRQCAQFQMDKDLDTFVSIVVLDEVGLAEDSPRMPLKTLHPLLEDGCQGDEKPEKYKKVAFIGISNWALDPAKMNRGILVQREVPDLEELKSSASGICNTQDALGSLIEPLIEPMAESYLETFEKATQNMREFYGLRDFYSLVKMVYSFVEKSKKPPTWYEMLHAIKRNFGGLDQVDPVEYFRKNLSRVLHLSTKRRLTDPDCTPSGLIQACLFGTKNEMEDRANDGTPHSDSAKKASNGSRYLLLLTENYGALSIIQQQILSRSNDIHPITIFGSSFRSDQEYTQVCRNINKIKVCMETGNTVVLLNLENLYESLYDALNQYYVYFGGERYVDLGLGTHRVKCPVHKNFRLIVVAEKQTVYKKFPIPLINRLEKHFLTINTMLTPEQQDIVKQLENWAKVFITQKQTGYHQKRDKVTTKVGDVFIGYHDDTCSAIVLHVWEKQQNIDDLERRKEQVLEEAKLVMLWCATPESLMRLDNSGLPNNEKRSLKHQYLHRQQHDSLLQYLEHFIGRQQTHQLLAQVTTHSKLLAGTHKTDISKATGIAPNNILLLETLSSFDTEQQFTNRIQQHMQNTDKEPTLMVIQCDSGDVNANLIACARYCVRDEFEKMKDVLRVPVHVVFIVQLPRGANFTGFQCGIWHSAHIDDLYTEDMNMPTLRDMQGKSVAGIFDDAVAENVAMEVDQDHERKRDTDEEKMDWTNTERIVGPGVQRSIMDLRTSPLKLEDVVIDLETVEEQPRQGRLNVKGLILNCVQAALSMVKDKFVNSQRETERVSLVLKLLHQETDEGHISFLRGVCRLIAKLLREKESKTHTANMAQHWLINEAASNENINKAGTFRRSCLQTLEGKVSPILAGIIAYLDTNENLSILEDYDVPWKQKLWLTLLNTTDGLNLQLTDLLSPERKSDLQEVYVTGTGCEGHTFRASMPFSWLVISQISEILRLPKPTSGIHDSEEIESRVDSAIRVLHDHPLGRDLADVTAEESVNEAVQNYIQDFVHTLYYAASEQEHQLVVQSVYYVSNQIGENTSLLQGLIHVHIAYETLAPRLTYFRAMNSVWPECSSVIIDLRTKNPDHFMFKEKEFTFSTLCLLIENLTPKATDLNNQQGRSKWLSSVHKYRSVVEKVISLHGEDPKLYGEHTFNSVRRARNLWSRVMVVKLFLEHVCTTDKEDKITIKHCMPLWTILGEETDLKEIGSLSGVEKFLKSCNKQAMKEYIGSEEKCCHCELVLEGPPITLPCKDVVCDQCYDGIRSLGENMCAKCHKNFPKDWEPTKEAANKKALDRLKDYQKRCNTFFMDIVSQLCFAENTPPSQEVVNKLLGYIFFTTRAHQYRTRNLTIFDTGLDPNPVFRSFLLQLLMRTSEDSVMENLGHYLQQAVGFIKRREDEQARVELSLLVIQCLEDMFTQEADNDEVHYATQALYRAKVSNVEGSELTVQKLYGIASARTGLAIAAKYIADIVLRQDEHTEVEHHTRKLIEAAHNLCDNTHIQWYRVYLVKYMCRRNGIEVYQALCRNPAPLLRWISFKDTNREQVAEVSDRYIVCGDSYISLRESVTKVVLGEDAGHLVDKLQELHTAGIRVEPMLQLALHREVTISNIYPNQSRKITARILQNLDDFVGNCQLIKNKQFLHALVHNQLVPRHLVVYEGEDLRQQGIQCLIVHFLSVMAHLQGDNTLLQPIMMLIRTPLAMQNVYLPTMPQDDLEDVKEALLAARNLVRGADNNPVFYRCPNGHPYVIGDCGRPATVGHCKDCGAVIGGEGYRLRQGNIQDAGSVMASVAIWCSLCGRPYVVARCKCGAEIGGNAHQLLATNRQDTGTDTTQTGHILGRAEARGRGAQPERQLTPAYCSAVRMLLHLAMYLGAGTNRLGVQTMIKPNIAIDGVEGYIWDHIMRDLDDLHIALGLSVDDVMLLMHSVIDNILRMHNEGEQVRADISQWNSKPGRREWENAFSAKFLQVVFQNLNNILKTENQRLAQDQRLGADPLLCLLYETDTKTEAENAAVIEQIPRVWRYRTPISLQHLRQEVQAKLRPNQHKVLQLFLQEEHNLRAMRYIPSILRLHRALFQKYQRKLDKAEASHIKVAQLCKDEVAGQETNQLLNDYAEAWELVRRSLDLYLCPTEIGGTAVSKEYCTKRITDKTPIAMLLPTMKEAGLCSYALLDFLLRKQNDFLDKYLKETQRKPGSISSVQPREVTFAHLIGYDPQHDIQPLILANCQYSFEIGKGTKIEYDFAGLERQLMDRFLFSKSRIDVGRVLQIDLMIYRTEFTNAEVFRKLSDKIPQEPLSSVIKTQISREFRSLPDLCQSLDNLDITISFLKSTGGPSDRRLHDFMLETLQMESSLYSQKAQQVCEFRHAQSLWLLLSLLKSKKMTDSHQSTESTFESVSEEFHKELPAELYTLFKEYALKKLSVEKLTQLVEVLHAYILLVVAVRQNRDDEDYTDTTNNKLCEWLQGYIDGLDPPPIDVACLADFPKDILYEHSVHTWVSAYTFLKHK